ncbi:MAG: urea ABC transporter permease subunit UrtC [Chloroflexi bacterium]|nr:urea ABC transporter permease subunit UrtC [Chloroflexota bacterium]
MAAEPISLPRSNTTGRVLMRWLPVAILAGVLFLAPSFLSEFRLNLLGRFLTYAIVAVGLNLIWGYGGMLSMGQGLFFGLGAYAMGMYLKLEATGNELPDFMSWSGLESLPGFWQPFHSPVFAIAMAILVPAAVAVLIGFPIFRSRTRDVYFSIITQALTLIVSILFIGQQPITGGTNGLTSFMTIFNQPLISTSTQQALYGASAICLIGVFAACTLLVQTRFGKLLVAMRDDEDRVRFLGYNPAVLKTIIFAISAAISGLAGALFVPQVGIISPSALGVVPSIEMVIWVAVGGRGDLFGSILGALIVSYAKSTLSEMFPVIWQLLLGGLFVGVVVLFPKGAAGLAATLIEKIRKGRGASHG